MIVRIFGRIVSFVMPWEVILGYLIQLASKILKDWLLGMEFTKKAKYFTMAIYVIGKGLGKELVADTRTPVDDDMLASVITLCAEIATKGNFNLPIVPEL